MFGGLTVNFSPPRPVQLLPLGMRRGIPWRYQEVTRASGTQTPGAGGRPAARHHPGKSRRDVLITNAACDVGFFNSSNSSINDMLAQVLKHIVDSFFHFQLEIRQRVFHATEQYVWPEVLSETMKLAGFNCFMQES